MCEETFFASNIMIRNLFLKGLIEGFQQLRALSICQN